MRIKSMKEIRDVIQLHSNMGLSIRKICRATGVARSTVADYVRRFKELDLSVEQIETLDDDSLRLQLFPEVLSTVVSRKAMPDMNYIHQELKRRKKTKVTLSLLWEEYKRDHPNGYEYTQFRVYYRRFKQKLNPSMRQTHLAGEKVFVDYSGLTIPIHIPK
ncbi:MAG: helix-turn-helix domain-containing protein [Campylobacterota bacterium]|nr:helix-turn-helix domain-containing protein [Campylobacterota bacterium]